MTREELIEHIEKQMEDSAQMGEPPSFAFENVTDAAKLLLILRADKTSAEIYFAGIDDAISYLGGCTFGASEMSTVHGVLSLLKSFKRQGGYSAYKQPSPATSNGITK